MEVTTSREASIARVLSDLGVDVRSKDVMAILLLHVLPRRDSKAHRTKHADLQLLSTTTGGSSRIIKAGDLHDSSGCASRVSYSTLWTVNAGAATVHQAAQPGAPWAVAAPPSRCGTSSGLHVGEDSGMCPAVDSYEEALARLLEADADLKDCFMRAAQ